MESWDKNPYAAPDVETYANPSGGYAPVSFQEVRFSTWGLLGLYVATCGLIGPIWLLWRKRFLDSLDSPVKLGAMSWVPLVLILVGVGFTVVEETSKSDASLLRALSNVGGIVLLLAFFRVRRILEHHFARTEAGIGRLSGVMTFFFGALYLQYKMNEAADRNG